MRPQPLDEAGLLNNVTQIVIGKSARPRWFEIIHGSVVHDLVRRSGNISVHVIAGDTIAGEPLQIEHDCFDYSSLIAR